MILWIAWQIQTLNKSRLGLQEYLKNCNTDVFPAVANKVETWVNHVRINFNNNIIWWLTNWEPCHNNDIIMEYQSIARLNETSCRSWYRLITWYHGPTRDHLYMSKHGQPCYHGIPCQPYLTMKISCS